MSPRAPSAAGLDVVDLAELARLADLLDHLHISVKSGLEADGEDLAALLFCLHNLNSLVEGYGEGLLEEHVYALLECVNCGLCVLTVVGADRNCVESEGLVVEHFLVGSVFGLDAFNAVLFEELCCLAGNEVCACNDLNVGLIEVSLHVRVCDPAASDDTDAKLPGGIDLGLNLSFKGIKSCHRFVCHCFFLQKICIWFLKLF